MALEEYGFDNPPPAPSGKDLKARVLVNIAATSLAELDLDKELLDQYKNAKQLLKDVDDDEETPLNQKAQIMNTITAILTKIIENQTALYDAERIKLIESVLIDVLKGFPEINQAFLLRYKEALSNAS